MTEPQVKAIAPWYGSCRITAHEVGRELHGCSWVGVPFAGSMCELEHIRARTMLVSDRHRHVINLAKVIADPVLGPQLIRTALRLPFHPDVLADAQRRCIEREQVVGALFVTVWMGRSGKAGTDSEFTGGLAVRWNANGGDSAVRYRSAARAMVAWRKILARCNFVVMDCFEFFDAVDDAEGHGLYCDPPFPGPGDRYKHRFNEVDHRRMAARLLCFERVRVVCRFYDHPLVRELYPESHWRWRHIDGGRKSTNVVAPEVLLVRGAR